MGNMSIIAFLIVGSLALVTLGVVGWFLTTSQVPERTSEHDDPETVSMTDHLDKDTFGPADPGAEVMNPEALGGDQSPPSR